MVLLSCGCDVDNNALTLCQRHAAGLLLKGAVVYPRIDHERIAKAGRKR